VPISDSLVDDFTTQDNTRWTGWSSDVAIVAGQLRVNATAAYPRLSSATTHSLVGSAVYVEVPHVPNQGNGSTQAFMSLNLDANNNLQLLWEAGTLTARVRLAGAFNDNTPITYNANNHRWWRISEASGTVAWAVSPDGRTWTTLRTLAAPFAVTSLTVALYAAFAGSETAPGHALYDNLNVAPVKGAPGRGWPRRVMYRPSSQLPQSRTSQAIRPRTDQPPATPWYAFRSRVVPAIDTTTPVEPTSADVPVTFAHTATAVRGTTGAASVPSTFGVAATATVTRTGTVDQATTFAATSTATRSTQGAASRPATFTVTADGTVTPTGQNGDLYWSGYGWTFRTGGGGPQYNGQWASTTGAWVDGSGYLHLKIQRINNVVHAAEIVSVRGGEGVAQKWGYGTYRFTVGSPLSGLHPNVVLGLFTYDGSPDAAISQNEIDIEVSGWSWPAVYWGSTYYLPAAGGTAAAVPVHQYDATNSALVVSEFTWEPNTLTWRTWLDGDTTHAPDRTSTVTHGQAYSYTHSYNGLVYSGTHVVPTPADEQVLLNLWAYNENAAYPAGNTPETEIIVRQFQFTPYSAPAATADIPATATVTPAATRTTTAAAQVTANAAVTSAATRTAVAASTITATAAVTAEAIRTAGPPRPYRPPPPSPQGPPARRPWTRRPPPRPPSHPQPPGPPLRPPWRQSPPPSHRARPGQRARTPRPP